MQPSEQTPAGDAVGEGLKVAGGDEAAVAVAVGLEVADGDED
jgi:hypothetical protein